MRSKRSWLTLNSWGGGYCLSLDLTVPASNSEVPQGVLESELGNISPDIISMEKRTYILCKGLGLRQEGYRKRGSGDY